MTTERKDREERAQRAIRNLLRNRELSRPVVMSRIHRAWRIGGVIMGLAAGIGVYAFTIQRWELLVMCLGVGMAMSYALKQADTTLQLVYTLDRAGEVLEQAERLAKKLIDQIPKKERETIEKIIDEEMGRKRKEEPVTAVPQGITKLFEDSDNDTDEEEGGERNGAED